MFLQFKLFIFITSINELVLFVTLGGDFTVLIKLYKKILHFLELCTVFQEINILVATGLFAFGLHFTNYKLQIIKVSIR